MVSKKFGKLLILESVGFNKFSQRLFKCKCDCGIEKVINASSIKNGSIISCGCHLGNKKRINAINKIGMKIGRLTVLEIIEYDKKYNRPFYKCICDCGKIKTVHTSNLKVSLKGITSCGCLMLENVRRANSKRPYEYIYNRLVRNNDKNIPIMTYEEFIEFTEINNCHYCKKEVKWDKHSYKCKNKRYNLDRKDNSTGYIKSNCCVCCWECNQIKGNRFNYEQMLKLSSVLIEIQIEKSNNSIQPMYWHKR